MMPSQIELVQSSFQLIKQDAESAMMLFYDRLFQLDPSLRYMFRNSREEQARKLAHVLTVVVKGLSCPEQILPAVEELGRRHANYGVQAEHYATVGAALLWTLGAGLGDRLHPRCAMPGQAPICCSHLPCSVLPLRWERWTHSQPLRMRDCDSQRTERSVPLSRFNWLPSGSQVCGMQRSLKALLE